MVTMHAVRGYRVNGRPQARDGANRVYLLTQLLSQVLPPSSENACLDYAVSGVMPQDGQDGKSH